MGLQKPLLALQWYLVNSQGSVRMRRRVSDLWARMAGALEGWQEGWQTPRWLQGSGEQHLVGKHEAQTT